MSVWKKTVNALGGLYDNGNRVYSSAYPPPVNDGWTYEYRATDFTENAVSLTNVFTGFLPTGGVTYKVEVHGLVDTAVSTTGFQGAMNGPAVVAGDKFGFISEVMTSATGKGSALISAPGGIHAATSTVTNPSPYLLYGWCRYATTPASNVRFAARSEVNASQVTMYAKAVMRWMALP